MRSLLSVLCSQYTKQDDGKVRDLGLAIEKVTRQVAEASGALEAEVTETQGVQIQLDKTAEDFRQLHADRQELVRQWEAALDTVRQRDQARHCDAAGRLAPRGRRCVENDGFEHAAALSCFACRPSRTRRSSLRRARHVCGRCRRSWHSRRSS